MNTSGRFKDPSRASSRRGLALAFVSILIAAIAIVVPASTASAYTTTGCKWGNTTLRINYSYVASQYTTGLSSAKNNYNSSTPVLSLSLTTSSGPSWTAATSNYGNTGWEAHANWTCAFGKTSNCSMRMNQYYLNGTEPWQRHKVIWAHEMGHCLGLGHVSTVARVMYTSATAAYNAGVRSLTSDEINGINAIY